MERLSGAGGTGRRVLCSRRREHACCLHPCSDRDSLVGRALHASAAGGTHVCRKTLHNFRVKMSVAEEQGILTYVTCGTDSPVGQRTG